MGVFNFVKLVSLNPVLAVTSSLLYYPGTGNVFTSLLPWYKTRNNNNKPLTNSVIVPHDQYRGSSAFDSGVYLYLS